MKTKWLYFIVAAVAISAVLYPVLYAEISNSVQSGNPFECAPLIPCQPPAPGFLLCQTSCTINMYNSTFDPGTVNATIGATITWVNHDGISHTVTPLNSTAWTSPIVGPGRSFTVRISNKLSARTYYYFCSIHLTMIGQINVVSTNSTAGQG